MLTAKARSLRDAGRLVEGLTKLVEQLPRCTMCHAEGVSTEGLVTGPTKTGEVAVMCERHFTKRGAALGPKKGQVLIATGPEALLSLPRDSVAAGYGRAILEYRLAVLPPHRLTYVATKGARRERVEGTDAEIKAMERAVKAHMKGARADSDQ